MVTCASHKITGSTSQTNQYAAIVSLTRSEHLERGGGGGGGGGRQRPVLSRFKKMPEHGTKVGQSGIFFPWTFSIEVNPDSKPDEGLKQPCFSLIGLIDEF